jgi:hypothetical protein
MISKLSIFYCDPDNYNDTIPLHFKIRSTNIAQKWATKLKECIDKNYPIDDCRRFYGFNDYDTEKSNAISSINNCIDVINTYSPGFVTKRVENAISQDTLNYLHHIFEVYHGLLDRPHPFFINAPDSVKKALAKLNIDVHRCELFLHNVGRKIMPRHIVTFFAMDRNTKLEDKDYQYFTDSFEFGTIYLLYVEIGKTLEDLSIDNDSYIAEEAYKPFRHYTADFVIKFFSSSLDSVRSNRLRMKDYYNEHKDFFDEQGLPLSHPYNFPGSIPVADLMTKSIDIHKELSKRQMVKSITIS